jgi:S-adenosylmethionine hydrolase
MPNPPIITLTTDMAGGSYYLAALKASIYSIASDVRLVDVSNEITAFSVRQAAFALESAYRFFPKNTIHIVHVNASESRGRLLIAKAHEQYFILFDNGAGPLIFEQIGVAYFEVDTLDETGVLYLESIKLAIKTILSGDSLGQPTKPNTVVLRTNPVCRPGRIQGHYLFFDSFHNAITNISKSLFEQFIKERFSIWISSHEITKIDRHYSDVAMGELVVFFNQDNLLEVAVNQGKAESLLGLKLQSAIIIEE